MKLFVASVFCCLALAGSALAADPDCAEFPSVGGVCYNNDLMPWAPFGGGWTTVLKLSNVHTMASLQSGQAKNCTVQGGFELLPLVPSPSNHQAGYFNDNRIFTDPSNPDLTESWGYWLNPGESVEVRFLYPPAGPDVLATGSVMVEFSSTDPACIRGLIPAQVNFLLKDPLGVFTWNASELQAPGATVWSAPLSASADWSNPGETQDPTLAVANPSGTDSITVRISLVDQNGQSIIATGNNGIADITLLPQESRGIGLRTLFGPGMFPGGNDVTGTMYVSVISPDAGVVLVCILQRVGNGMGSLNPTPLQ